MFPNFSHYCQPHPFPNYIRISTQTNCKKVWEVIDNVLIFNKG